jgi:hypothetical protein
MAPLPILGSLNTFDLGSCLGFLRILPKLGIWSAGLQHGSTAIERDL